MTGYASNTGTKRNLDALRAHNWSVLLTPDNPTPPTGLKRAIDNGAWRAHRRDEPFNERGFCRLVERHGAGAEFVVIPDIVAGGMASLDFSLSWIPRLQHLKKLLLPVQDGMDVASVGSVLQQFPNLGIFLGGSTEWKLKTILQWGIVAATMRRHYHVGRVNTMRRIRLCAEAGASSFDGTSATMFSCTLAMLDSARRQPSLLTPQITHAETAHG